MHSKKPLSIVLRAEKLPRGSKSDLGHLLTLLMEEDRKDSAKIQSSAGARHFQSMLKPVVNRFRLLGVFLPSVCQQLQLNVH